MKNSTRLNKYKNNFFEVEKQFDLSKELKKIHATDDKNRVMINFKNGEYIIFEFFSELTKDEFELFISME